MNRCWRVSHPPSCPSGVLHPQGRTASRWRFLQRTRLARQPHRGAEVSTRTPAGRPLRASRERPCRRATFRRRQELAVWRPTGVRRTRAPGSSLGARQALRSPWVAVDLAGDTVAQARLLRRAHEVVLSGCGTPLVLRELIVRSWERSASAGVDPDCPAPMLLDAEKAAARFAEHPLSALGPMVRGLLDSVSVEARHLV